MTYKFENWSGTHEKGKRAPEELKEVRVSEGTRSLGRDPATQHIRYESAEEEYAALVMEKKDIEVAMATRFSKAAFTEAQSKVRQQRGNTLQAWLKIRSEMQNERGRLIERLKECEKRMTQIRGRVCLERQTAGEREGVAKQERIPLAPILLDILAELQTTNELLRLRNDCPVEPRTEPEDQET